MIFLPGGKYGEHLEWMRGNTTSPGTTVKRDVETRRSGVMRGFRLEVPSPGQLMR